MSIQRRPAIGMETMWFKPNANVMGAWRCNSKNDRDFVIDKLCRSFSGLHTHFDNGDFVFQKRDVPVFKIPSEIKTLEDIEDYVDLHYMRQPKTALATIAASEDTVVLVGCHSVLDGGSLAYFNKLLAENGDIPEIGLNPNTLEPFMEKIKAANYYLPSRPCDEDAVRYVSKDTERLTTSSFIPTIYENLKKTDFKIYNKNDDKLHGFTESVLAAQILSMSALNGKFGKVGVWEVFGTRPYPDKNFKLTQGQYYSDFNVVPKNVTENDSLQTLMKKIRESMNSQMKNGAQWAYLKGVLDNHFEGTVQKGQYTILSSLGEFKMGGPIKDFRFKVTGNADFGPSLNVLTFNVKTNNDNKYYFGHSHSPQYYSFRESKAWIKSVKHCISKINLNTKIGDAVSELIDLQKNIFKEYDDVFRVVRF